MTPHFVFPASMLNPRMIDEAFQDQAIALKQAGFGTSVFNTEARKISPLVPEGATVVYRGWMMTPQEYAFMQGAFTAFGLSMLTSFEQYQAAHYLPNWYPLLERWTPTTTVIPAGSDLFQQDYRMLAQKIGEHVLGNGWAKFQLKDYVKSLKTDGGSTLEGVEDITPTLEKMQKYRGSIEGGICIRQWEHFYPNSETRYFMIGGKFYGQEKMFDLRAMSILDRIKDIVPSPFYSVDIAQRDDGAFRIVEIGDGQVSDLVGWTPERFAEIWKEAL